MKTLEEEARFLYGNLEKGRGAENRAIFIAGANSKWVQAERIKAQIEMLYTCIELTDTGIRNKANELEQQLKQLEDEKDNSNT